MDELYLNIQSEQAMLVIAPPGWGKTYKLLNAIKKHKRKTVFVFPLRALCDEVYLSSIKLGINTCNCRTLADFRKVDWDYIDLVLTTPECIDENPEAYLPSDTVLILDECHLIYYWGESFRERMFDCYLSLLSLELPLLLLSATINFELLEKFTSHLELNYQDIFKCDFGNQKLKNMPKSVFYYPRVLKHHLMNEIYFSNNSKTSLVFCKYRNEVFELSQKLEAMNYKVLSCVGGEAKEFVEKLQITEQLDFIVATSVVSHGVNLPEISKIIFTYKIENLDFYIQMLGRGGRDGSDFEVHTHNLNYFSRSSILLQIPRQIFKIVSNRLNSYLYYLNAC